MSKHRGNQNIAAFTLIEMMFIILILAVITVQIAQTEQQKTQAALVERVAGDMQVWETALINYNVRSHQWPTSLSVLTQGATPLMPVSTLCSPFTSPQANGNCGSYAAYQGSASSPQASYYILSVHASSAQTATLLAAKLQNSWISSNTVNTAIPSLQNAVMQQVSGAGKMPNGPPAPNPNSRAAYQGWLVSAGVVATANYSLRSPFDSNQKPNPGSLVMLPNCPWGFEGHIILA
ncbi:MAG: type II secretion system protein, partial [Gammaproteobacteria bacterium]